MAATGHVVRAALTASSAAALLAAAPAWAAPQAVRQAPSASTQAQDAGAVDQTPNTAQPDVVVTAQKRAQTLIDVPQSVSVVSGATLEAQQANNFQDYLKLVPGVQVNQSTPGFGRLVFRGINTGGVASTVGVYVDETPFGSSSALANGGILAGDFDTFDVARVEVLRGPQGTLYGASSLSGVLKFVTNAPELGKVVARGRAGVETVDGGGVSYYGNAVLNVPLTDTLAVRASGTYRNDAGFIDSIGISDTDVFGNTFTTRRAKDINGVRTYGGRASLLFEPSTDFSVRLSAILQNIDADAPTVVASDPITTATLYGGLTQSQFVPASSSVSYRVYNGLINANLGFATLTSSSSYAKLKQQFRTDLTFNLSGFIQSLVGVPNYLYLNQTTGVERYTQEVRLASAPNDVFEWLVGGFYTHESGLINQRFVPVTPGTTTEITTLPQLARVVLTSRYEEVAGFANGTLHLGRMVDVDFGGRYSHNTQSANQVQAGLPDIIGPPVVYPTYRSSEGVFTYSVAPKLKLNNRASIYARVAKGFRPGGPNILPPASAGTSTPATFASDSLVSYEGGFKGETRDRTFSIEVTGFHIDWSRIQLFAVVNNFGINVNGAGARSDGVEFTTSVRPIPGFDVSVNGAYTRARLTGDTDPLVVGGRKGDQLPFTPKVSIGINGDYRWAVAGSTNAFVGSSLRFLSKQSGDYEGALFGNYAGIYGRQRQIPSYDVVDLRGGLDFGKVSLEVYAKNLTNAQGKTSTDGRLASGLPVLPNGALGTGIIRPRTVGLSLTAAY